MKLENIVYVDEEMTAIEITSIADNGDIHREVLNSEVPRAVEYIEQFGGSVAVTASTSAYHKEMYDEQVQYNEWLANKDNTVTETVVVDFDALEALAKLEETTEADDLFKLKIAIFEKESVKSADRELKSKIRKSKSALEVVSLYASSL